jgi:mono/diheme cytochrome c family protein
MPSTCSIIVGRRGVAAESRAREAGQTGIQERLGLPLRWIGEEKIGEEKRVRHWPPRCYRGAAITAIQVAALIGALTGMIGMVLTGCDIERRKSDTELGLNPQQAVGRKIYDNYCDRCHEPYSTKGKKGPGLQGVFKNKYLSVSGLPANDERVSDIIRLGRHDMPAYNQALSQQQLEDLLAYMHTL